MKKIAITLGDPAGIGSEVTIKALNHLDKIQNSEFVILGDKHLFDQYGFSNQNFDLRDQNLINDRDYKPGHPNSKTGKASLGYLNEAMKLLHSGEVQGLVTAPVCKESIHEHYSAFVGHTELLSQNFGDCHVDMMFVAPKMRTVIVSRHIPLKDVSNTITKEAVTESISLTYDSLKAMFRIDSPRVAVCGLNPHAGENGLLGQEEIETIIPVIEKFQSQKKDVCGPFPADTLFSPDIGNEYDVIIAMYHDQGLIPIKTLYFKDLVNLTIGLPFVRTSPAHGTAFGIAGQDKADFSSMKAAIELAVELV